MNNISVQISPKVPKELFLSEEDITEIVNNSLKKLSFGLTSKLEIEIIFADKEKIRALNKEYRGVDATTDVLSFPQTEVRESLVNILGSIVICLDVVLEKKEELGDVIKHGLLHLLGYDHEIDETSWELAAKKIGCKL